MEKIKIEDVCFHYPGQQGQSTALEHVNLTVEQGEFLCLLGPSGCGKSTLLSLLEGLHRPDSGQILVDGKPVDGPGRDRAVVFQHYSLFPWLTARKNIIFGIKQSGQRRKAAENRAVADRYLAQVGLGNAGDQYPSQMSGGMQQRVAIARALAMEADILLMDEPFGAIDPKLRQELQELVGRLSKEHGKTVVFVTHDIDEAILLADRIVVMEPKQIRAVERVTIPRPRKRETLAQQTGYLDLRNRLMSLFYARVASEIYDEVML
jgi:NitT/TauT family transport system ATP-binding protein